MTKYDLILDAGHGGADPGAIGNGSKEKDLVLEITLYMFNRFKQLGVKVITTRTTDITYDLNKRALAIKNSGARYCISNHLNAFNGTAKGAETIHSLESDGKLATSILNELVKVGMGKRRVFSRKNDSGGNYYALHRLTGVVQTVIVEPAFIDNKEDYEKINTKEKREKIAEAVIKGFCEHIGVNYKMVNTTAPTAPTKTETKTTFKVQVGSFEVKKNAELLKAELIKKGYPAIIKEG